ncbi:S9 family peptidase [Hyunsoonleella pacifica]|uniref:S9 family peptidase n=1 Tax=Hyunsoonleella pacifica TaxID=1080224 RepID=A0A4Q9FML8_9FLAO|nr:S9 family peptidase [Hyunsoonleella pacifica]TBN15451.1 S9 family peptidase [Hyunsoonleella pacifica]GGD24238.1 peptidase S9 [Hyunsoonleella pacifica]
MKKLLIFCALVVFFSCKKEKGTKEVALNLKQYTIEQFMDNEAVGGGSFSPDKSKLLVSSNKSGIYNMYTVPTTGGEFVPITQSDSSSVFGISYFPEDERMLYRADNNGDEIYHIYLRDIDGSIKDLTPDEGARATFYGWAHDGKSFGYGSNKRDKRFMDIYEMNVEDMSSTLIYKNDEGYNMNTISSDKNLFALSKTINTNDSDLFIYNRNNKSLTKVNENQSSNSGQDFSLDGKSLYYTTDKGSEFSYVMKYDIVTGKKEKILEKPWDIMGMYFTHNEKYMVAYINEDGKNAIEITDVASGNIIDLPDFNNGNITSVGFSRDENMMRMYVGGSNSPANLFTYNIKTKAQHKLTDVLNDEIAPEHLVKAKVIRYKSFDGVEIPAIYYLPHQASTEHKVPALVLVHGGPGGQSRQNFSSLTQYLVNHGYAVLAVNNRGSSGYGKTFFQMDDLNHGEKDLQDCVEGKNWLKIQPEIDANKIGIMGGSYGGYMTMAALTYKPEEFAVGVNIFGVTNWLRTLKSIPPWWESFKDALYKELGNPHTKDSVRLRRISPLFHTDKVTKPLIVLQGAKDPRVLQVESDEIVEGVKKNGVPVEYVLFEDEGHDFVKKKNQIEAYSSILKFLDTYLKKENQPIDGESQVKEIEAKNAE